MPDRQIDYGEDETDATYRSGDAGGTAGGGNFVVAELLGDRVLMEWDNTANEWVLRGPVNMSGENVSSVGTLTATDVVADSVNTEEVSTNVGANQADFIAYLDGDEIKLRDQNGVVQYSGEDHGVVATQAFENGGEGIHIHLTNGTYTAIYGEAFEFTHDFQTLSGSGQFSTVIEAGDMDLDNFGDEREWGLIDAIGEDEDELEGCTVRDLSVDVRWEELAGDADAWYHEGIEDDYTIRSTYENVSVYNSPGDGIDIDPGAEEASVTNYRAFNCRGAGIHNGSGNSNLIDITAIDCGHEEERAGVDNAPAGRKNKYVNVTAIDCHIGVLDEADETTSAGGEAARWINPQSINCGTGVKTDKSGDAGTTVLVAPRDDGSGIDFDLDGSTEIVGDGQESGTDTVLRVHLSSDYNYSTADGFDTVPLDNVDRDTQDGFDTSTHAFVPSVTAEYTVHISARYDDHNPEDWMLVRLQNTSQGSGVVNMELAPATDDNMTLNASKNVELVGGDTYELQVNNTENDCRIRSEDNYTFLTISG